MNISGSAPFLKRSARLQAAHAEGAVIEYQVLLDGDEQWRVSNDPFWAPGICYRIQPPAAPKTWGAMNDAEKGALLLAAHEGKVIELYSPKSGWGRCNPSWSPIHAYRVKPEPVIVTQTRYGRATSIFTPRMGPWDTHKITFDVIDGEIDCASVKMEKL